MPDSRKILCFDTPRATVPGHSVPTEPIYEIDPGSSDVLADLICAMKACSIFFMHSALSERYS